MTTGTLRRLIGIGVILLGIALLIVFVLDDITILGIIDNIIPITLIGWGVTIAFPYVRLPRFGIKFPGGKTLTKLFTILVIGAVIVLVLLFVVFPLTL